MMPDDLPYYSTLGVVDNIYADTPTSDAASRVNSTQALVATTQPDAMEIADTGKKLISYIVIGVIVLMIARSLMK